MRYLALGDSVSIDLYTGVAGGGAAAQFARLINADAVQDLTRDGATTTDVLASLAKVTEPPDVVTLTAGGNDMLSCAGTGDEWCGMVMRDLALDNLARIADRLAPYHAAVILNTIYDPTDGDDALITRLGLTPRFRTIYEQTNAGLRALAAIRGWLLADLERLFHGHGMTAPESWFTLQIEPNYAGATAIAHAWARLYRGEG